MLFVFQVLFVESEIFYSVLQKLEAEFRRRNGRSSTVDSKFMEQQDRSAEEKSNPNDSSLSNSSTVAADEAENRSCTAGAMQLGEGQSNITAASQTQEENFVDSELIEKLLQEDSDRVRIASSRS